MFDLRAAGGAVAQQEADRQKSSEKSHSEDPTVQRPTEGDVFVSDQQRDTSVQTSASSDESLYAGMHIRGSAQVEEEELSTSKNCLDE